MSQFSPAGEKQTLASVYDFPKDVYPVGRLDYDSEGLLLLTNDKALNQRLLHPKNRHERTYLAQVEGAPTAADMESLENGIVIKVNGKAYRTQRAKAKVLKDEPNLPPRVPPIRYRKNVPDRWIELQLIEGKNRQVRKMTAKAGFPTLRLVRKAIKTLTIDHMQSGEVKELTRETLYKALFDER